jgi:hypothetical protein
MEHRTQGAIEIHRRGRIFETVRPRHQIHPAAKSAARHHEQREREQHCDERAVNQVEAGRK